MLHCECVLLQQMEVQTQQSLLAMSGKVDTGSLWILAQKRGW